MTSASANMRRAALLSRHPAALPRNAAAVCSSRVIATAAIRSSPAMEENRITTPVAVTRCNESMNAAACMGNDPDKLPVTKRVMPPVVKSCQPEEGGSISEEGPIDLAGGEQGDSLSDKMSAASIP